MNRKKYLFLLLEIILLICVAVFTAKYMYNVPFLILIFSPIVLTIILIISKQLNSKDKPLYTIVNIILNTYIGFNLFSIFASTFDWRGPFKMPGAPTNEDIIVFKIIVYLSGISLLISVLIIGVILYIQKKKSNK